MRRRQRSGCSFEPRVKGSRRRSKYAAERTEVDGFTFDSKREARYYGHLLLLAKLGEIDNLELQPSFPLWVITAAGERVVVGVYRADFRYRELATNTWPVVDAKGVRTPVYRLKKRIVEALYGFRIIEA